MINAAILDKVGFVQNVVVLSDLSEMEGAVQCPEWVGIGMHIDTPKPIPVPSSVEAYQAREALRQASLLGQVEAFMSSDKATPLMVDAWTTGATIRRDSPTVAVLSSAIGLTAEQVDQLFIAASQIRA